ncbi:MAG: adenosylmethionine--8-amino-7-oxononanoate transaminase [Myxococcales bacterium]|nr:adenosylmethionine--8-amino-7-oxononanoate transaminase [Myxococcales bacterium]
MKASGADSPAPGAELVRRDAELLWHPATHFRDLQLLPPLPIQSAQGAYLQTCSGERILDAISSWWTCLHGHGHPRIVAAIADQAARLDHVMFAGFTHAPALELAEALVERAPGGPASYGRVFYADCGSAAIEVALKMSFQYRQQSGERQRQGLATLTNSYHGETLGALAVSGNRAYREQFGPLLFPVVELPVPSYLGHEHGDLVRDLGADAPETAQAIALLEQHRDRLTALLVEPVIQCAGRMVMPGVGFYRALTAAAQRLGIHVIADEIAVGFGRTGRLFASDWADPAVAPDFLCLSKGLSGGVLPLSAVLVRRGVDEAFKGDPARSFLHSHTFTANPITCRAGLASLSLFDDEHPPEHLASLARRLDELSRQVAVAVPQVVARRQAGLVVALEVRPDVGWQSRMGEGRLSLELRSAALERGVLLRPLHDTVYWMPPYCVTSDDLDRLAEVTRQSIVAVLGR